MVKCLSEKRIIKFIKWLSNQGAEILPSTNEHEALRFRCFKGVGVIHRNGKGNFSVAGPVATEALNAHLSCEKWEELTKPTQRTYGSKRKKRLFRRDGDECFYCGLALGDDITEEHLVALSQGGPDRLENLVLAHESCNREAGSLPVITKVRLREKMRMKVLVIEE
ncbi:HNH endonuclease [Microbulbifer sp. 2205BS26-8]|uniref:HNH endonuclease n=1 Tax=Microbulbifer sp. 2205BS26-8 TaxID=3064386 RepID=UPI00273DBF39|nr:HNH endonuclease [Microbulbifer sp. 2205BS26-8]MDP5211148.1 HNH endonuclease [Microbulbifer sp. 2205BS26-8]